MNLPYTLTYLNTYEFLFASFIDVIARLVVVKRGFTCFFCKGDTNKLQNKLEFNAGI